jgi:hypothetical protein
MLEVVFPLSVVLRSVDVGVDSVSVGFIVHPVAFVDVSVYVPEDSVSMGSVVFPLALVLSPIRPDLSPFSVSESSQPLACVCSSGFEGVKASLLPLSVWIVGPIPTQSLLRLFNRKVFTLVLNRCKK